MSVGQINLKRDKSLKDFWRTPRWCVAAIEVLTGINFDVDVACNAKNALFERYIGLERDALVSEWGEAGTKAFLNPPYSDISPWVDACIREQARGVTTVMLVPQSIDTKWYLRAKSSANEIIQIIGGRIWFVEPDVDLGEKEVRQNTGGSMLIVFRGFQEKLDCVCREVEIETFQSIGGYVRVDKRRSKKTLSAA